MSWLLAYPDTYEVGLPNQGLQILYEILNERDDAVAERTYAPWRDLDALLRRARRPAVLGRHPPPGGRLRPAGVQPRRPSSSSRTCSRWSTSPACRCGPPTAGPSTRSSSSAATAAFNPEPLADFVDVVVLGDGEEVVGEITEVVGGWIARRARRPRRRAARRSPRSPACTCRRCTTSTYDGPAIVAVTPRYRRRAGDGRQAHRRRPRASGRTRSASSCR